jgi:uncharacterized protein (TIGR03083 family)
MTGTTVARTPSRAAALDRDLAMRLAATEYDRFLGLLRTLEPEDWSRPTDCPGWDVRAMAGHTLGMTEMTGSLRQFAGQNVAAIRGGGGVDALTAHQVRTRSSLDTAELIERFAAAGPRAVRGRRRLAGVVGGLPLPAKQVVGGQRETWRFGFMLDVILTRDPWMHRVDISRVTGRELRLTPEHDGVLVADVVAEWASRHRQPYRLRLTGPAGGEWSVGDGGPELELDAVEFCRVVSGRGTGTGLLAQQVPF